MLAEKVLKGDVRAAARLIRNLDDRSNGVLEEIRALYPHSGKSYVIGITGSPGCGKSTLVDCLIGHYRAEGKKVGVIAVDPTSPFSGGAILGDRIRMQNHSTDPGVFIRSMATRGAMGGLSRAAGDAITVLDAFGMEVILVETVGVGQDEVDIARLAHSCIVVTVPGLGDEIQAIKAGIMEIGDIFVINKADKEGADRAYRDLQAMIEIGDKKPWTPPILFVEALNNKGIDLLVKKINEHQTFLFSRPDFEDQLKERARLRFTEILRDQLMDEVLKKLDQTGRIDDFVDQISKRSMDPYSAACKILSQIDFRRLGEPKKKLFPKKEQC